MLQLLGLVSTLELFRYIKRAEYLFFVRKLTLEKNNKIAMSSNSTSHENEENVAGKADTIPAEPLVQYIAIRNDLKWPKGALIAQGCHASIAAIHLNYTDPDTVNYLKKLDTMHKIVVGVPNEADLTQLAGELTKNDVKFKLWMEQPENTPTSLALKPYTKSAVERFFKPFKLFK